MKTLSDYVLNCGIEKSLLELIKVRASQINGCAYCLDMHAREARKLGETDEKNPDALRMARSRHL